MNTQTQQQQAVVADYDKGKVTYNVAGQDVTLSFNIVRKYLLRGNSDVSDQDLMQFISICKFNQLNPFLNEAYLVAFKSSTGTVQPQMIVSKEAFAKRAEASEHYQGLRAGIIVQDKETGEIKDLEGTFYTPIKETLVGGWAQVYRDDRKFPYVSRVALSEYDKKQSIWKDKQSTMISKVAKVQALREAFPAQLGAMYTQEEQTIQDTTFEDVTPSKEAQSIIAEQRKENQQQILPSNSQSPTLQTQENNNFENGGANPQPTQAQQQPPFKLQ
ncbi:MAG: phage recombination protein Bet [Bacteroidales bacterium]|nr:phage recombination protein Bet [Bacteroidales bacterium]